MTETRKVPLKRSDLYEESDEPIMERAKRISATTGRSLRSVLREIRAERKARAEERALREAPPAEKDEEGNYKKVCNDPRWPFGIENEKVIAPYGFTANRFPKMSPKEVKTMPAKAKQEARDIIVDKLKRMGCDPIQIMAELAMSTAVKDEVRLRAAAELSSMIYPRLKGVENTIKQDNTVFVIGVPSERPETGNDWLSQAEGPRRALETSNVANKIIDGEAVEVKEDV